jgi:hypothetical protein
MPVFSPLSWRKKMSLTTAVPTDIIPEKPNPVRARVPTRVAKLGETADPTSPTIVTIMAISVIGLRP